MDQQLIDLFALIKSEANVRAQFIAAKQPETNHLEFKEKSDSRIPDLGEYDKRNFSKALSAFSNSDGGVLIWGIKTRRREGRDVAWTLKPIKQVEHMAERLRDSLLDTLMPQNSQVVIAAISNRLGNGYVKCLIPPSDSPPHRAMVDREYWARLDGRSVKLEHYIIRDMMLRHALPELQFHAITEPREDLSDGQFQVNFRILNAGRAIAKHAGWFASIQNAKILWAERCSDESYANAVPTASWHAKSGTVLHPNGVFNQVGSLALEYINKNGPISIRTKVYCEGMTVKEMTFVFKYPPSKRPEWRLGLPNSE